jgi:hypothetical protein
MAASLRSSATLPRAAIFNSVISAAMPPHQPETILRPTPVKLSDSIRVHMWKLAVRGPPMDSLSCTDTGSTRLNTPFKHPNPPRTNCESVL